MFKGPKMDPDCFLLEFKNGMLVRFVPSLDNCCLRLDFRYGCYGMRWWLFPWIETNGDFFRCSLTLGGDRPLFGDVAFLANWSLVD